MLRGAAAGYSSSSSSRLQQQATAAAAAAAAVQALIGVCDDLEVASLLDLPQHWARHFFLAGLCLELQCNAEALSRLQIINQEEVWASDKLCQVFVMVGGMCDCMMSLLEVFWQCRFVLLSMLTSAAAAAATYMASADLDCH
eukprot:gene15363-biopygen16376